jgi:hypothetical protein
MRAHARFFLLLSFFLVGRAHPTFLSLSDFFAIPPRPAGPLTLVFFAPLSFFQKKVENLNMRPQAASFSYCLFSLVGGAHPTLLIN